MGKSLIIPQNVENYIINNINIFSYNQIQRDIKELFEFDTTVSTIIRKYDHLRTKKTKSGYKLSKEELKILSRTDLSRKEIQQILYEKFGRIVTTKTVGTLQNYHGIRKHKRLPKTNECIIDFCKNNLHLTLIELRVSIYETFNIVYTVEQLKNILHKRNLKCKTSNNSTIYLDGNKNNLKKENIIIDKRTISSKFYQTRYEDAKINEVHYKVLKLEQAVKEM